jgi:hypothetical protein
MGGENERSRDYAEASTLWLLGQYLGWVEILRREVQFLDLGRVARNRRLQHCLAAVEREFASDAAFLEAELRIFRADQRGIGEIMVSVSDEEPRPRTRGYAEFAGRYHDPAFSRWFGALSSDLHVLASDDGPRLRMRRVQRALVDLVDELDPDRVRYPNANVRGRLVLPQPEHHHLRDAGDYLARFAVEPKIVDIWKPFHAWASQRNLSVHGTGDIRSVTRAGRRGLRYLEVEISVSDGWATIEAWSKGPRWTREPQHREPVRHRSDAEAVDALLGAYGRPPVVAVRGWRRLGPARRRFSRRE